MRGAPSCGAGKNSQTAFTSFVLCKLLKPVVCVIFHRLGPYHWTRLVAAAAQCPLVAIELSSETLEYAWDKIQAEAPFEHIILFPTSDSRDANVKELVRRLWAALDKYRPEIVLVPGWSDKGAMAALWWCVRTGTPVAVMSESTAWDEPRTILKEAVKRRILQLFATGLAGGNSNADYLNQLGMPRDRIFLGYDVVDNDYFAQGANKTRTAGREMRINYGLPENYFLASARFIEKKNLPRLVQAYARYRELASNANRGSRKTGNTSPQPSPQSREGAWDLVILGDGPLRTEVETRIAALGIKDHVHLPGFKQYPDLPAYYGLAGCFVHASTTEQWGLVVNEAMASRLPVLVSNRCGCAQDLVQNGVNGFTFDPCDVDQIAGLMNQVSVSKFPISDYGAASQCIIADWSPARFAQGLSQAVNCARKVGSKKFHSFDKLLLRLLLWR